MKTKIKAFIQKLRRLILENDSPKEIALGMAIGVFIGFSPLYGFHTLLAVLVAFMMKKTNRLAIIAGTQISFLAPVIYWAEYKVGKSILFWDWLMPQAGQDKLMEVNNIGLGLMALAVGSVVLGVLGAVAAYFVTMAAAKKIKAGKMAVAADKIGASKAVVDY